MYDIILSLLVKREHVYIPYKHDRSSPRRQCSQQPSCRSAGARQNRGYYRLYRHEALPKLSGCPACSRRCFFVVSTGPAAHCRRQPLAGETEDAANCRCCTFSRVCLGGVNTFANMEIASSDDVGLVRVSDGFGRGLEAQISSVLLRGKEVPLSHVAKTDISVKRWECGSFSWRILRSLVSSGCIPERRQFMKVHH